MDDLQLAQLLASSEGTTLEFKKSLEFTEHIARTICAFANTFGGYLIIGAEKQQEKTAVAGVSNADKEFQKLAGIVPQVHPKPYYTAAERKYENKTLVIIHVEAMPISEVCFFKKTAFRRVGSFNEEISGPNLVRFLQQRGTASFEENKSPATPEDLDDKKILRLLEKKGVKHKEHEPLSLKSILGSLGAANIIGDFYLKNVAVLFFAKNVQKFLLNPEVRIVKYRGKEKSIETREQDQRYMDTLPELLDAVFRAVREKAGTFGRIIDGKRLELPMIPEEVLREALTNAVGHRDYFDPNGILIEIFDDRIEITNPGSLLPGQTLKNFAETRKHRNPITYRLLNDSQWGEGLNLGIKSMYRIMRQNKLPDPDFEDLGGMFKVTLFGPLSDRKPRPYGVITERQKKAIDYLQKHGSITAPAYAKMAGISHPTAITDLNDLVAHGALNRMGRFRSSKYVLEKH